MGLLVTVEDDLRSHEISDAVSTQQERNRGPLGLNAERIGLISKIKVSHLVVEASSMAGGLVHELRR